jgi:Leucine-rich repeat (LRR) protein
VLGKYIKSPDSEEPKQMLILIKATKVEVPENQKIKKDSDIMGMGGVIESDTGQRVLHFPNDRSLGELKIQDADTAGPTKVFYNIGKPDWWMSGWVYLGEAKGDVTIPAGKVVALRISKPEQWRDLSPLRRLDKDALYLLNIEGSYDHGPKPRDASMKYIAHLTGLQRLEIMYTYITARGLQQIEKLKSLETMVIAGKLDNAGLAVISKQPSLKNFYIHWQSQITNAGMEHVGRMKLLEELEISGQIVGDEGLKHLSNLPRLRFLKLYGERFSDEGMKHLREIPELKYLDVNRLTHLTDKALMYIAACNKLETVSFHQNENITNKGAEYLSVMKSLKRLYVHNSLISDEGLKYISQIKSLEELSLPYRNISDIGLAYLPNLVNLKHLSVARDYIIDPEKDKGFYTDKGVKELSKLSQLEGLSLDSRGMTDESMDYVSTLTNLKDLSLGCINVTDKGLVKLGKLKSLERLSINCNCVTYENMTISGLSALSNLPNLRYLNVEGMTEDGSVLDISGMTKLENLTIGTHDKGGVIRDEDLACLANLKDLKWFQINSAILPLKPMAISDKGMAHLESLTKMERLTIGGNLTDEGLKSFRNMKNMDMLSIYGGKFTDEGLRYLEGLTKMRNLTIDADNNFSQEALEKLRGRMPLLYSFKTDNEYWGIGSGTARGMGGGMGGGR